MEKKTKVLKTAVVTLKRPFWNGYRKLLFGEVFTDKECYEGKYNPETADVEFEETETEPTSPKEEKGNENDLSKVLET